MLIRPACRHEARTSCFVFLFCYHQARWLFPNDNAPNLQRPFCYSSYQELRFLFGTMQHLYIFFPAATKRGNGYHPDYGKGTLRAEHDKKAGTMYGGETDATQKQPRQEAIN